MSFKEKLKKISEKLKNNNSNVKVSSESNFDLIFSKYVEMMMNSGVDGFEKDPINNLKDMFNELKSAGCEFDTICEYGRNYFRQRSELITKWEENELKKIRDKSNSDSDVELLKQDVHYKCAKFKHLNMTYKAGFETFLTNEISEKTMKRTRGINDNDLSMIKSAMSEISPERKAECILITLLDKFDKRLEEELPKNIDLKGNNISKIYEDIKSNLNNELDKINGLQNKEDYIRRLGNHKCSKARLYGRKYFKMLLDTIDFNYKLRPEELVNDMVISFYKIYSRISSFDRFMCVVINSEMREYFQTQIRNIDGLSNPKYYCDICDFQELEIFANFEKNNLFSEIPKNILDEVRKVNEIHNEIRKIK